MLQAFGDGWAVCGGCLAAARSPRAAACCSALEPAFSKPKPVHPQVWKVEDFLAKWERGVSKAPTPAAAADRAPGTAAEPAPEQPQDVGGEAIARLLAGEMDAYRRCLPYLKTCCRGIGWEDSHWAALFALLGLRVSGPGAVSKESLTLAHLLDRADALVAVAERIRALDAQVGAQGACRPNRYRQAWLYHAAWVATCSRLEAQRTSVPVACKAWVRTPAESE
jgi:hypothetical protein